MPKSEEEYWDESYIDRGKKLIKIFSDIASGDKEYKYENYDDLGHFYIYKEKSKPIVCGNYREIFEDAGLKCVSHY